MIQQDGQLLRIYIGETDKFEGRPLYEWILKAALDAGLAGATALRGLEGFGRHSRMHTAKVLSLSADLPMIIEIVDTPDKIAQFLPQLDQAIGEGLATLEKVSVRLYREGSD